MHIKRFLAESLTAALAEIKLEFGDDAWILSTRETKPGVVSARRGFEVVAATEVDVELHAAGRGATDGARSDGDPARWRALEREVRALRAALEEDRRGLEFASLRAELRALREEFAAIAGPRGEDSGHGEARRLHQRGFSRALSRDLAVGGGALQGRGDRVRDALAERLDRALVPPHPERDAAVELFVGAPGVGKTTSIAKIAGRDREHCALLSSEPESALGSERLRRFARRVGAPFATTRSERNLSAEVCRTREQMGRERILIDTPGNGRRDWEDRRDLQELRTGMGGRLRVHWVASATAREAELRDQLLRFAPLQPDTMILTKADEAVSLAPLAGLILDPTTPPLSWLGVGTDVPEDLALPDPRRLSARMIAGPR